MVFHYAPDFDLFAPIDRVSPRSETNYNNTTDHATAISSTFGSRLSENTDVLNNWMSNAADYFDLAIQEELAAGHYSLGTATRPTTITFEMITTNSTYERDLVAAITEDWEQAFALAVSSHREADGSNPWMSGDTPLIRLDVTTHEIAANSATQQDDMLTNGVNGYWFRAGIESDEEKIVEKMIQLLIDKKVWEEMSTKAYEMADRFSKEHIMSKWDAIIDNVLSEKTESIEKEKYRPSIEEYAESIYLYEKFMNGIVRRVNRGDACQDFLNSLYLKEKEMNNNETIRSLVKKLVKHIKKRLGLERT